MRIIMLILFLLAGCGNMHTGGFWGAGNNGAAAGVSQSFRW